MTEPDEIMKLHKVLLRSSYVVFPFIGKVNVSNRQGVYIIYSPNDKVFHVGKTDRGKNGLNQRL